MLLFLNIKIDYSESIIDRYVLSWFEQCLVVRCLEQSADYVVKKLPMADSKYGFTTLVFGHLFEDSKHDFCSTGKLFSRFKVIKLVPSIFSQNLSLGFWNDHLRHKLKDIGSGEARVKSACHINNTICFMDLSHDLTWRVRQRISLKHILEGHNGTFMRAC